MGNKEGKYELYVGDVTEDFDWTEKGKETKYEKAINVNSTCLRSDSKTKLKQIIKILNLRVWEIKDRQKSHFGETVEQSKLVKETNERARKQKEKETKMKEDKVKAINKLPERYLLWDYDSFSGPFSEHQTLSKTRLELRRTEAKYIPHQSSRILYSTSIVIIVDGVEQKRDLYLGSYVTRHGRIQQKKFNEDWFYGMTTDGPEKQKLNEDLRQVIQTWKRIKNNIEKGILDESAIGE